MPGHAGIGRVVAMSKGVKQIKDWDMVDMPWLFETSGLSDYCLTSCETVCVSALYGWSIANRGLAHFCFAPAA